MLGSTVLDGTDGGASLTVAIENASVRAARQARRARLDLAQHEPIGAARVARARQAFILHDVDAQLLPRAGARLQRDGVGLAVRIRAAGDDEAIAGFVSVFRLPSR